MEYTQWGIIKYDEWYDLPVLILVVMEYTQWGFIVHEPEIVYLSLNPCCNGIYSMSHTFVYNKYAMSLNPCCNGIYSMRSCTRHEPVHTVSLNPCCNGIYSMSFEC